jgi:energy-coupling factor transporter ATP-binding protein EcfA2
MTRFRFDAECRWKQGNVLNVPNVPHVPNVPNVPNVPKDSEVAKEVQRDKWTAFTLADVHVIGPLANVRDDLFRDTEVFSCFDEGDSNTLLSCIQPHMSLKGSTVFMSKLLRSPCASATVLEERVAFIRRLECQGDLVDWKTHMQVLREHEDDLVWLMSDDKEDDQYAALFFQMWPLKHLNDRHMVIEMYAAYRCIFIPLMGLLSPLIYILTTYLVLRIGYGFEIDFRTFLSIYMQSARMLSKNTFSVMNCVMGALYASTIYSSCETALTVHAAYRKLCQRISRASKALEACLYLRQAFKGIEGAIFKEGIINNVANCKLTLSSYKSSNHVGVLRETLYQAYAIDTCLAISSFRKAQGLCHARFRTKGSCLLRGFWHPCITSPVKNDMSFGPRKNVLLTGPNAAGKSSCLKAVSLLVLMSQTLTVACASRVRLTPFHVIHSHIHVPDCKGKESLFEAEMARCLHYVKCLDELQDKQLAFCVIDEIFNSTNPIEGQSAAFAACTALGKNRRSVGIISTHYDHLTTIGPGRGFVNHKMAAIVSKDGDISYPFRLRKGVARQYLVFEIMKAKGFDSSIIDAAIQCKRELLRRVS